MKSWYLFFLFSFFTTVCLGQDHILSFENHRLSLTDQPFYISQVVDKRSDTSNIGWIRTGSLRSKKTALLAHSLSDEVAALFSRTLPADTAKRPIIVHVLKFQIGENTESQSEVGFIDISLQFLYEESPGNYLLLSDASSTLETKGADVTPRQAGNLVIGLNECLTTFSNQSFDQLLTQATPFLESASNADWSADIEAFEFPILRDTVYRKGVYASFMEFRNNAPSQSPQINLITEPRTAKVWQGTNEIHPYLLEVDTKRNVVRKKPLKDVWGFSDGEQVYISFLNEYYPLNRLKNAFTFDGHVATGYSVPAVVAGAIVGGMIGGAIAGAVTANHTANNQRVTYALDMLTGKFTEASQYTLQPNRSAKIVVYFRHADKGAKPLAQVVLSNRQEKLSKDLEPNTYWEVNWQDLRSDLSICLQDHPTSCYPFIPEVGEINYFEYVPETNPSKVAFILPVTVKEGEFYTKQIRLIQEAEAKRAQRKNKP